MIHGRADRSGPITVTDAITNHDISAAKSQWEGLRDADDLTIEHAQETAMAFRFFENLLRGQAAAIASDLRLGAVSALDAPPERD
jgi:hypothetical protein